MRRRAIAFTEAALELSRIARAQFEQAGRRLPQGAEHCGESSIRRLTRPLELVTVPLTADHQTRWPVRPAQHAGFTGEHRERSKAGTEWLRAVKPR